MACVYLVLLLIICQTRATVDHKVTQNTELEFAFMTHRNGDSTPTRNKLMIEPSEKLLELIKQWGYGQLTTAGKRTSHKLGQFIRRRYDELLSPMYNKSEIYIRSTDSTRAKMTVLTAMSAVYPAVKNTWSEDIHWVPVPYTTEPAEYDFNAAFVNCPDLVSFQNHIENETSLRMDPYSKILAKVSEVSKFNLTSRPILAYKVHDSLVNEHHLGSDIGQKLTKYMPFFEFAASEAMDIIYGDSIYIDMQAGVLLNEFFKYANEIINCTDTQRVRVYSAHDFNVYSLESVSHVKPRQGYPKYGSVFSLELRRVPTTGEFVVLPVYLPSPNEREIYLRIEGCDLPCSFDKFQEITLTYRLDFDTWRTQCGFTKDYKIDTTSLD